MVQWSDTLSASGCRFKSRFEQSARGNFCGQTHSVQVVAGSNPGLDSQPEETSVVRHTQCKWLQVQI